MRVVIADDNLLVRRGIAALLEEAGIEVNAQAGEAGGLLDAVDAHVARRGDRGHPHAAHAYRRGAASRTGDSRAASRHRDRDPVSHVEAGVAARVLAEHPERLGYLLKDRVTDVGDFIATLERVAAGGTALDPQVISRMLAADRDDGPLQGLTEREREVLQMIGEGLSNPAIAERLGIALRSAEKHVSSIFAKLGLPDTGGENRRVLAVLRLLRG